MVYRLWELQGISVFRMARWRSKWYSELCLEVGDRSHNKYQHRGLLRFITWRIILSKVGSGGESRQHSSYASKYGTM